MLIASVGTTTPSVVPLRWEQTIPPGIRMVSKCNRPRKRDCSDILVLIFINGHVLIGVTLILSE